MDGPPVDAIILGHGLAGACLAWHLRWRGWRVLVVDRDEASTSSKVAAGIVAPISGRRVARSWRVDEFLPVARAFYERTAGELGAGYYRPTPYVRLLRTADERRRWQEKRENPGFQRLLTSPQPDPLVDPDQFHDAGEGLEMQGAWLDVRAWLEASQRHLMEHDAWLTASVPPQAVTADASGVVVHGPVNVRAQYLIFCQGWEAAENPFFPWLKWKSAKGEILTVRIPALKEQRIVNGGVWLLPLGRDGLFRAGSTYAWDDFTSIPTAAARGEIEARLRRLLRVPFSVTGHGAGIRPVINESKAVIGLHPVHPRIGFFNGLGSKGVLHAPFFAAQLAALLVDGAPVEYELDVCRNSSAIPAMLRAVEYSHQLIRECLAPGDMAIDATAGNGHDTLFLARLTGPGGMVFAFDVQDAAVAATRTLLDGEGVTLGSREVFQAGHERMRELIPVQWHGRAGAVLFNLGYLPGSDKSVTTAAATTVSAMQAALTMLRAGGLLVAVMYTGHPGGEDEARAVLDFAAGLPAREFHAVENRTVNARNHPPFVLAVQKNAVVE